MIDCTANGAMIMASKVAVVTGDALAAARNSRGNQATVGRIVAGGAGACGMHLTNTCEGRGCCRVTTGAVDSQWGGGYVFLDLGAVVVDVGIKVSRMAVCAGATIATVDRGITMTVDASDPGTIFRGMTENAAVVVNSADGIAGVAAGAERGWQNRGRMAVGVAAEVGGMASGACASGYRCDVISVGWVS